jgi:hypothetical protein
MNLSGPYQRLEACCEGQKGGAMLPVAFRSRPVFVKVMQRQLSHNARADRESKWLRDLPAWQASVWDEVHATAGGALLRRIKILITDGTQLRPEEAA